MRTKLYSGSLRRTGHLDDLGVNECGVGIELKGAGGLILKGEIEVFE